MWEALFLKRHLFIASFASYTLFVIYKLNQCKILRLKKEKASILL